MIRREESQNLLNPNLYLCRAIAPQGPPVVLQDQNGLFYAPDISSLAIPTYHYPTPPSFIPFMSQYGSTSLSTTTPITSATTTDAIAAGPSSSPLRGHGSDGSFEQLGENSQHPSEQSSRASSVDGGQPHSAAAWLALLAASTGDSTLAGYLQGRHQPILITTPTHTGQQRFSYLEFCTLSSAAVRNAVWNSNERGTDYVNFYLDDSTAKSVVKRKLTQAFKEFNAPKIVFKGNVVEEWPVPAPAADEEGRELAHELPPNSDYTRSRKIYQVWKDANLLAPPLEELKEAITYAGFKYKDNKVVIDCIMGILTIFSNFAICETTRKILRKKATNPNMVNCLESLVNLMHAPFNFKDRNSQLVHLSLIADAANRLYASEYDFYLPESVRVTTAGTNHDDQSLTDRPTRHVGILFPYQDYYRQEGEDNVSAIATIRTAISRFDLDGGIDFAEILRMQRACQDLLYHNHWNQVRPYDDLYIKDITDLIYNDVDVFGIDKPKDRSAAPSIATRDIKYEGNTYVLRNCNESHVSASAHMDNSSFCLTCGAAGHFTTSHQDLKQNVHLRQKKRQELWFADDDDFNTLYNALAQDGIYTKSFIHKHVQPDPNSYAQKSKVIRQNLKDKVKTQRVAARFGLPHLQNTVDNWSRGKTAPSVPSRRERRGRAMYEERTPRTTDAQGRPRIPPPRMTPQSPAPVDSSSRQTSSRQPTPRRSSSPPLIPGFHQVTKEGETVVLEEIPQDEEEVAASQPRRWSVRAESARERRHRNRQKWSKSPQNEGN